MTEKLPQDLAAYQWALPEGIEVPRDELTARLDFYQDSIIFYLVDGSTIKTRMVSARDVTMALLQEVPMTSGLLPQDVLWWSHGKNGPEVALWRSARVWQVALQLEAFQPPRRLKIPMPGLIFVCSPGRPPRVYAAKKRPTSQHETIYHAPLFNVFSRGDTCPGTHRYPLDVAEIPESFFTSFFTPAANYQGRSKRYPDNLQQLWEELDGKKRYPLKDLVPIGKIEDIMK